MASDLKALSQSQVSVLQWICDGCPDGVFTSGHLHRITARSLATRGIVAISGHGPTWHAELTDHGRECLTKWPLSLLDSDSLIKRVLAERWIVVSSDPDTWHVLGPSIARSMSSPHRPAGQKLSIEQRHWPHERGIALIDFFEAEVPLRPVRVRSKVTSYHASVRQFLDDRDWQYVSRAHLQRAARILQAIVDESPRRGFELNQRPPEEAQGRARYPSGHIRVETPAGLFGIMVREISGAGTKPVKPVYGTARRAQPLWIEARGWEFLSTGNLEVVVDGPGTKYNGDHYRDTKRSKVEEKLPELFQMMQFQSLEIAWRQKQAQLAEARRMRAEEEALARAKAAWADHARWEHFAKTSGDWQRIQQHRRFLSSVSDAVGRLPEPQQEMVSAQLDFATAALDKMDATVNPMLLLPDLPTPSADDLRPFF